MKLIKVLSGSVALLTMFAFAGVQAEERQGVELGAGFSHSEFDGDGLLDTAQGWLLQAGYRINNQWSVELMRTDLSHDIDSTFLSGEVDVNHLMLNGLYHFNGGESLEPFISLGVGQYDLESIDDSAFNIGAGLKYYFNDIVMLRPELRFNSVSGDIDENFIDANLILSFLLGGSSSAPRTAKPADADGDGVSDNADACPGTPKGVAVDSRGCPLDSDGDGVYDYLDQCPDTARKLKVDAQGCPVKLTESVSIRLEVKFDTNSAEVKPEYYGEIRKVAEFLEQYQGTKVVVEGHTDTRGDANYNKDLSQRRADAVAAVLVQEMNIASDRVKAVGFGEERPIADDSTRAGQEQNRRVVGEISTQFEKLEQK